jgi:hypothetical protein
VKHQEKIVPALQNHAMMFQIHVVQDQEPQQQMDVDVLLVGNVVGVDLGVVVVRHNLVTVPAPQNHVMMHQIHVVQEQQLQ